MYQLYLGELDGHLLASPYSSSLVSPAAGCEAPPLFTRPVPWDGIVYAICWPFKAKACELAEPETFCNLAGLLLTGDTSLVRSAPPTA